MPDTSTPPETGRRIRRRPDHAVVAEVRRAFAKADADHKKRPGRGALARLTGGTEYQVRRAIATLKTEQPPTTKPATKNVATKTLATKRPPAGNPATNQGPGKRVLEKLVTESSPGPPPAHRQNGTPLATTATPAPALAPHWASIRHHVRADRDKRADVAVASGFESVLATLHPTVSWRAPVLDVDYPVDQDLHLDGRGIVLLPSFFCWSNPITLLNQFDTPVLVYPVERDPDWLLGCCTDLGARTQSLTALLGHTRTAVLRAIADRSRLNTTDLARTIGISLAGASQHATVLRNAGLVTTVRHRGSALHQVSARGTALLNQCPAVTG